MLTEIKYTCSNTTMAQFVKCIVHGDDLNGQWENVFQEYCALSGDSQISQLLSLLKSIATITNRLQLIEIIINQLAIKPIPGLVEQLRDMGFALTDNLDSDLKRIVIQCKQQLLQLDQDKAELEELRADQGQAATEQDYEMQYSAIESWKGVAVDPDRYTVARYIADVTRMKQEYVGREN